MVYVQTPFANLLTIQIMQVILNPEHKINCPENSCIMSDKAVIDATQLCLLRNPAKRPPIVGVNGLLNGHCFLNLSHR